MKNVTPTAALAVVKESQEFVEPPVLEMCCTEQHISIDDIERGIAALLVEEESHRQKRAICAIRAGAGFYMLRKAMEVSGRKYTGFWQHCETRFGVNRATISRKMRLAANWAAANGAKAELLSELAQAASLELTATTPKAVQLAFDWIGDLDLSDLYRREKLVNYGPRGGDMGNHVPRRTNAAIRQAEAEARSAQQLKLLARAFDIWREEKLHYHLSDDGLRQLQVTVMEFAAQINAFCKDRKI
jgi:hypothetical protein